MGFRYRKSVKLPGGIRINASKSGIGSSIGMKGLRVTKTSTGSTRTTMSVPGSGISFVSESGNLASRKKSVRSLYGIILFASAVIIVVCSTILLFTSCTSGNSGQEDVQNPPPTQSTTAAEIVADSAIRQTGREYLTGLGYEVVATKETEQTVEFAITLPGLSELDPASPPDDWDDSKIAALDAANGLRDSIGDATKNIVLRLQDDTEANVLTLLNGKESYSLFSADEEASSSSEVVVIVWISDDGTRYHLDPDCSNMREPRAVRKSYAIEKGYIACSRCAK